jgi:hypothetical protein
VEGTTLELALDAVDAVDDFCAEADVEVEVVDEDVEGTLRAILIACYDK